jgi:hypothetical protein
MIVSLFINFFLLILAASYTANLTSVLVADIDVVTVPVTTFKDANVKGQKICGQASSAGVVVVSAAFPNIQYVQIASPGHVTGAAAGLCDGFSELDITVNMLGQNNLLNPKCDISKTLTAELDFALELGYSIPFEFNPINRCTDFFGEVLTQGVLKMKQDGTMATIYDRVKSYYSTLTCPAPPAPSLSILPSDMGGVFIIYCLIILLGLMFHFTKELCCKPYIIPRVAEGRDSGKDLIPAMAKRARSAVGLPPDPPGPSNGPAEPAVSAVPSEPPAVVPLNRAPELPVVYNHPALGPTAFFTGEALKPPASPKKFFASF